MALLPFDNVAYNRLADNNYKYLELLGPNGQWEEHNDDEYHRQFIVKGWKGRPEQSIHYVLELSDPEVRLMVDNPGTLSIYLQY